MGIEIEDEEEDTGDSPKKKKKKKKAAVENPVTQVLFSNFIVQ
jgi:flagellar FliL protein